jgi:phage tail protein X
MRGAPLKAIQELMGHSKIEMTMRYAHLSPDVKKDAVQLLDRRSYGNLTATEALLAANPAKQAQKIVSPTGTEQLGTTSSVERLAEFALAEAEMVPLMSLVA